MCSLPYSSEWRLTRNCDTSYFGWYMLKEIWVDHIVQNKMVRVGFRDRRGTSGSKIYIYRCVVFKVIDSTCTSFHFYSCKYIKLFMFLMLSIRPYCTFLHLSKLTNMYIFVNSLFICIIHICWFGSVRAIGCQCRQNPRWDNH